MLPVSTATVIYVMTEETIFANAECIIFVIYLFSLLSYGVNRLSGWVGTEIQ